MNITILSRQELEALPVFEGFYTINHIYTREEAEAREAERQERKKRHR